MQPTYGSAFPDPFPRDTRPTPDEIAGVSTQQAIIRGINQGLDDRQLSLVKAELDGIGNQIDGFMEKLALALEAELNSAQWTNQEMSEKVLTFTVSGLLPAVETAMGLAGFLPAGAPGQGKGGKAPRRRKRPNQPVAEPATEPFPAEPVSGPSPGLSSGAHPGWWCMPQPTTNEMLSSPLPIDCTLSPSGAFSVYQYGTRGDVDALVDEFFAAGGAYAGAATRDEALALCCGQHAPPVPPPGGVGGMPLPPVPPPLPPVPRPRPPIPPKKETCCPETLTIQCDTITIQAGSVTTPDVEIEIDKVDIALPGQAPPSPPPSSDCYKWFSDRGLGVPRAADPLPDCNPTAVREAYGDFLDRAIAAGAGEGETIQQMVKCGLCKGPVALGFNEPERPEPCGKDGMPKNPYDPTKDLRSFNYFLNGANAWIAGNDIPSDWPQAAKEGFAAAQACGLARGQQGGVTPGGCDRFKLPPPLGSQLGGDLGDCLNDGRATLVNLVGYVEAFLKRQCDGKPGTLLRVLSDFGISWRKEGGVKGWFGGLFTTIAEGLQCLTCAGVSLEPWIASLMGCPGAPVAGMFLFDLAVGIWERWVGHVPEKFHENVLRLSDFLCPTEPPSEPDARRAWLRGALTDGLWECIVRTHNQRPDLAVLMRDAERETITPEDALLLARRGALTTSRGEADSGEGALALAALPEDQQKAFLRLMRRHGFTTPEDVNLHMASQRWTPEPVEGIEWMLKDLGDPQIADRFGLWNEFKLKYRGHVKEVMDWHGITEQDARHLAAAHLQSVAPTQLYEMHKRLRPGYERRLSDEQAVQFALAISPQKPRGPGAEDELASIAEWQASPTYAVNVYPGTENWRELGYPETPPYWREDVTDAQTARAYLANLVTTGGIVYEGLSQARYPTFWRERLEAISYRVLTRVDARRAYEVGQIDLKEMVEILQDQGYDQVGAERLGAFYVESLIQKFSTSPVSNQWVKEGFSLDKLFGILRDKGMRSEMWAEVLPRLERRRALEIERECLKAVKGRFLSGRISDQGATNQLASIGFGVERINDLISEWNCLKKAKPRQEQAAEVIRELVSETITTDSARRMLRDAGYTGLQAGRIIRAALATAATEPKARRKIAGRLLGALEKEEGG